MSLEFKKGSELCGRYVISDFHGQGGFAVVWRATDKKAGRDVAIQRLQQGWLLAELHQTFGLSVEELARIALLSGLLGEDEGKADVATASFLPRM